MIKILCLSLIPSSTYHSRCGRTLPHPSLSMYTELQRSHVYACVHTHVWTETHTYIQIYNWMKFSLTCTVLSCSSSSVWRTFFNKTKKIDRDMDGDLFSQSCYEMLSTWVIGMAVCWSLRVIALRNNLKFLLQRAARALGMSRGPGGAFVVSLPPTELGLCTESSRWEQSRVTWRRRREVGEKAWTRALLIWPCEPFNWKTDVLYHLLVFCEDSFPHYISHMLKYNWGGIYVYFPLKPIKAIIFVFIYLHVSIYIYICLIHQVYFSSSANKAVSLFFPKIHLFILEVGRGRGRDIF